MKKRLYEVRFSDLDERNGIWKVIISSYLNRYFKKNDTILDIGCGFGEFINNVKGREKIGLDIDKKYKGFLNNDITFLISPADRIPLKKNSVDKVFISNVFEHLERKTIEKTIREIRRVLKDSGEVIVLQPNIRFTIKDYWMFFDHITPIDDRALTEIFTVLGFVEKEKILKFLPFTTKSKMPKNLIFIKIYLTFPVLWNFFGKQSLLIYQKAENV